MASNVTDYFKNYVATRMVGERYTVKLHTANPGSDGTNGLIGTVAADITSDQWSDAASGIAALPTSLEMGELSSSIQYTVRHYSFWLGNEFCFSESFSSPQVVNAGQTFAFDANTLGMGIS